VLVFMTTNLIFMDPCIVDYSIEIPTRYSFVIEFIISKFISVYIYGLFSVCKFDIYGSGHRR